MSAAFGADVVVLHADRSTSADVIEKLEASGRFGVVDEIPAYASSPAAVDLTAYDAILVYSVNAFDDADAIGDLLADYVDLGGGVVQAALSQATAPIGGRFAASGYEPLQGGALGYGHRQLLDVIDSTHPTMDGVYALDNGSMSYHVADAALSSTAILLGQWTDGVPAVAADDTRGGYLVGLNLFPPSSDAEPEMWVASTDGAVLLANALEWVSSPDTDGDTVRDRLDNCLVVQNSDQGDTDGDGRGDACDLCPPDQIDTDVDGVCDDADVCPGFDDWIDVDGDQAADGCDACPVDNPNDADGDGSCTSDDVCFGASDLDQDADAICDENDVCPGFDDGVDTDEDGQANGCDCAPQEPLAQTGAVEVCDDVDNDCDGEVDPLGTPDGGTYYLDLDQDGFGADDEATVACDLPLNYATVGGDCDDDNGDAFPGAPEFCDGVDSNCDGAPEPDCGPANVPLGGCGCTDAAGGPGALPPLVWLATTLRRRRKGAPRSAAPDA